MLCFTYYNVIRRRDFGVFAQTTKEQESYGICAKKRSRFAATESAVLVVTGIIPIDKSALQGGSILCRSEARALRQLVIKWRKKDVLRIRQKGGEEWSNRTHVEVNVLLCIIFEGATVGKVDRTISPIVYKTGTALFAYFFICSR